MKINTLLQNEQASNEAFFNGRQAGIWTALPGIVQSFNPEEMTCEVQPAVQGKVVQEDGSIKVVDLPMLLDCPVVFPHAGGCSITFPIKVGDECLVIFSSRAIDFWWQSGGVQPPAETRMHDLSDGFVLPGPWSQPNRLSSVSIERMEIRSDDHKAIIAIHPKTHDVSLETDGNVTEIVKGTLTATISGETTIKCPSLLVDCPQSTFTGALTVNQLITGQGGMAISGGSGASVDGALTTTQDVVAAGISLQNHIHPGDSGGTTGKPQG